MERTIKKISHHYILCGAGKNGHYVLEELIRTKRKVVAVEKDPKKVQTLINRGIPTIEGDASSDNVLRSAGIDRAIGLVSTLPEDKDNLFVVITARSLASNACARKRLYRQYVECQRTCLGAIPQCLLCFKGCHRDVYSRYRP